MDKEKAINKISALLNLAESSNLNEASVAWAQAQTIAFKYKIDLNNLSKDSKSKISDEITDNTLYSGKRSITWKSRLAYGLAKLNGCRSYTQLTQSGAELRIVGHLSDLDIVTYFFNSISSQIEKLALASIARGEGSGKTYSNNFKFGAVHTVLERLQSSKNDFIKEYGSTALVLIDRGEIVQTWLNQNKVLKVVKKPPMKVDNSGFANGQLAGKNISLYKGLTN